MKRLLLSLILVVFTISFSVSTSKTNLEVVGAGKGLYGRSVTGIEYQLIGASRNGVVEIDIDRKGTYFGSTVNVGLLKTTSIATNRISTNYIDVYSGGNGNVVTPNINFASNSGVYGSSGIAGLSTAGSWYAQLNGSGVFATNGTVSASALQVNGNGTIKGRISVGDTGRTGEDTLITINAGFTNGINKSIAWFDGSGTTAKISVRYNGSDSAIGFNSIFSGAYNTTEVMTLRGNGNVGIGTTAPSTRLEVAGTVSASALQVNGAINANSYGGVYSSGLVSVNFNSSGVIMGLTGSTAQTRLDLIGNGDRAWSILAGGSGGGGVSKSISIYDNTASARRLLINSSGDFGLGNITNAVTMAGATMVLLGGNVGIGTTAPSTKLEVAGTVSANEFGTGWIDYSSSSTVVGWSSFVTKTIRYKTVGNLVFIFYILEGTSNSATTTFTVPFTNATTFTIDNSTATVVNNSVEESNGRIKLEASSTTCTLIRSAGTAWTASGTKVVAGQFFYQK